MKPRKKVVQAGSPKSVDELLAQINAKYGDGTILVSSKANLRVDWISSGCYALDFATGGGFPKSRITEIFGPESSGKTTICLSTIASFQKANPNGVAVFVDLERTFDPIYAYKLGCNAESVLLVNPDSGEQGLNVISAVLNSGNEVLIVIDSIAAMMPLAEMEAEAEQQFMGLHARFIGRLMRLCTARMKRNLADASYPQSTVIAINQVREKIGVMFGDPTTTPGGRGKNFFESLRIRIHSSSAKSNQIFEVMTQNGVKKSVLVGTKHSITVVKNKCGHDQCEEASFEFYRRPYKYYAPWSYDNTDVLLNEALYRDVISLDDDGTKFFAFKDTEYRFKQPLKFGELLAKSPVLERVLYKRVLKSIRGE